MDQSSIPTVAYRDFSSHPWPRLIQIIAILTMLVGAAYVGQAISLVRDIWGPRRTAIFPATTADHWLYASGCALEFSIGALFIFGALSLLRRRSNRLILIGAWTSILIWPIGTFFSLKFAAPAMYPFMLMASIMAGVESNIFPVFLILLLRAHRMT